MFTIEILENTVSGKGKIPFYHLWDIFSFSNICSEKIFPF